MSQPIQTTVDSDKIIFNDIYNGEFFSKLYINKIIWCRDYGGWFIYNGKYWQKDNNDSILKYAVEAHSVMVKDESLKNMRGFKTHIKRSSTLHAMTAMINCAKAFMGVSAEQFDNNNLMINMENGIFDLSSCSFGNFDARYYLTKRAYVKYEMAAQCPRWIQFLDEIFLGDKDVIDFMQRVAGYCMTGLTTEQCMFILYGHGRNGKSKFLEAIINILGDYALNCPSSTFIIKQGNSVSNDVARLKGARMVTAIESNQNVNLDESLIKQVTGGDRLTARFLNKEFFEFTPTFKIFFATNHKPNIRGTDTGIWRRISMIPFNLNITAEQEDKDLGNKLRSEASGIFNWMVDGYKSWAKNGLMIPNKIKRATQIYREEEDDVGQFIKSECIAEKGGFIAASEFRDRFREYAGYHKGRKILMEYMERHGYVPGGDNRIYIDGKQMRGYVNLRWIKDYERKTNNTEPQDNKELMWKD